MRALVIGSLLVAVVACAGDDDGDRTAPPVPSATSGPVAVTSLTSPGSPAATASASTTTTEVNPVPPTPAPPTAPTTINVELPPVPTLVPEVPDELLTPEQRDPFNVNNSRPILPEHLPVIEAHLAAIEAFNLVASTWPLDPNAAELLGAPLASESLERNRSFLADRSSRGELLDVSQGITFRPYIVGPVTDTAVLLDCELAGHYWTSAASGEVLPPDSVWPAGPGHIVEVGLRVNLVLLGDRWLVESSQIDSGASA